MSGFVFLVMWRLWALQILRRIHWVMWFREEWTQAPKVAPFLEKGGRWERGDVVLIERDREDGYGWIWFEVVSETAAQ